VNWNTPPRTARLWVAGALASGVLLSLPFWVGRFVPLLDLPQHLALATVLASPAELGDSLSRHFIAEWGELTPYWVPYGLLRLLAFLLPIELAARLYLTLYAFAFPFAGVALCRAFGRSAEAGLLVAPLAFNANLYYGFLNYSTAVVLLLLLLAAFERTQARPTVARIVGLAVFGCVIFFTHVQVWAFVLLVVPALALMERPRVRRLSRAALALAPAGLLGLTWVWLTLISGARRDFGRLDAGLHARWEPLSERLLGFPAAIAGSFADGSDTACLALWAATLALLLVFLRPPGASDFPGVAKRILPLLVVAVGGAVLAPHSIMGQWNIAPRFALLALLPLPALLPVSNDRARERWVVAAAVVLCAVVGLNAAWHHHQFDREVGAFDRVLASIPPGQRLLGLAYDSSGRVLTRWPYLHFAHYYTVRSGGVVGASFAAVGPMPVRLRRPRSLPHPDVFCPETFRCAQQAPAYDYVLSHGGPRLDSRACPLRLIAARDRWRLYRVVDRPPPASVAAGAQPSR
jgi:hypothetical protein